LLLISMKQKRKPRPSHKNLGFIPFRSVTSSPDCLDPDRKRKERPPIGIRQLSKNTSPFYPEDRAKGP